MVKIWVAKYLISVLNNIVMVGVGAVFFGRIARSIERERCLEIANRYRIPGAAIDGPAHWIYRDIKNEERPG